MQNDNDDDNNIDHNINQLAKVKEIKRFGLFTIFYTQQITGMGMTRSKTDNSSGERVNVDFETNVEILSDPRNM